MKQSQQNGDKPFDKSPKICNFVSATIKDVEILPEARRLTMTHDKRDK